MMILFVMNKKISSKSSPTKKKRSDSLLIITRIRTDCDKYARFIGFDLLARRVDRRSFRGVGFGNDEFDEYEEYEY